MKTQLNYQSSRVCTRWGGLLVFCFLAGLSSSLSADTLLIHANDISSVDDVVAKIQAGGWDAAAIHTFDASVATPTLDNLKEYDSVLVWSDSGDFNDSDALGNVLADYSDSGRGVVEMVFANANPGLAITGAWAPDYQAIEPVGQESGTQYTLGTVLMPEHPIMQGVSSFDGGTSSYRSTGGLMEKSRLIAEWSDGAPLIAEKWTPLIHSKVVSINFFPPSSDARSDFWDVATDGHRIMANALTYAADGKLTTTLALDNNQNGAMFDLTSSKRLEITGFDFLAFTSGVMYDMAVYYVTNHTSYVGNETNSSAWTLLGVQSVPTGSDLTHLDIGGLVLYPNETVGIYITSTDAVEYIHYKTSANSYSNPDLTFDSGVGKAYPFGATFTPRTWSGRVCYEIASAASLLMNTDGVSSENITRAGELGHEVTTNSLAAIITTPVSELSRYDTIWVNPGETSAVYDSLRSGVANGGALEQYVTGGGVLVINVASNYGSQANIAPGGVDYDRTTTHNAETFTDPGHPYLTGEGFGGYILQTSDFDNWNWTDHGWFTNLAAGSLTVLNNPDGPSWVEYPWGRGKVIVTTLIYGWMPLSREKAQDNMINYAAWQGMQPPDLFVYYEDFEDGLDDFVIDNAYGDGGGLWHLTTSCQSPSGNHSTPTSLYYGQDGTCNYDNGVANEGVADSPIIDLTGVSGPISLSFKYFLDTEGAPQYYDKVWVYVSENGGPFLYAASSNPDAGGYVLSDPTSGWQRARVDLSDKAGSRIQLRFRFKTVDGSYNTYPGLYIDDIAIARPSIFHEDFESGPGGFDIDNTYGAGSGLWHRSTACESSSGDHTTPYSMYFGQDATCNYDIGVTVEGLLISPVIDLRGVPGPVELAFKYFLETEDDPASWDQVFVDISENGGPYTTVATSNPSVPLVHLADPSTLWRLLRVDLSAFTNSKIQVRIRFDTYDSGLNAFPGLYVDDFHIRAKSLLLGDMDFNCFVDLPDIELLSYYWLDSGTVGDCELWMDLTQDDCRVNLREQALIAGQWQSVLNYNFLDWGDIVALDSQMSTSTINASDGSQFWPGTYFVYKTNDNRYGKFVIEDYEPDFNHRLTIGWVTYNADGSVYRSGHGVKIRGTWFGDLDVGQQTTGSNADFLWYMDTTTERRFIPQNGAKYIMVYRTNK